MTRVLIFDLDGTLVDTPRAIVKAFTATFAALGVAAREPSAIRATIGLPLERAFSNLLGTPLGDGLVARSVKQYQALFKERILPQAERLVFPGVAQGLDALRREGFTLAVATSKVHASAEALLEAAGLRGSFSRVVGADQVARPKPDPEMGRLIMRDLGLPCDQAVVVGDTVHDVQMARAAGMRSVAVTYGVHGARELEASGPTWMAASFEDVVRCLRTNHPRTG